VKNGKSENHREQDEAFLRSFEALPENEK